MSDLSREFLRTDFGHEVYDKWYLEQGSYNFEAPEFVERHFPFYEKALQLSKDDNILEAGCGIGSYAREFTRRGYHVVGMDLSPNFLSEAKKITQHDNLEIEFILGDYNEMNFEERFNVIFFEGSFFYQSKEGLVSLLSRIHKALTPNGRVYFVHKNPSIWKQGGPIANWSQTKKNVFVLQKAEYDENDGIEKCIWLKIDLETQKHYKCDFFVMHLPPDELKDCLMTAGFMNFHFHKKRRLGNFDPKNDNDFSVVARK